MGETAGRRVVVTGATGNVGTDVVRALGQDPDIAPVVGIARRVPEWSPPKTTWAGADLADGNTDLTACFRGADAVVRLAWLLQPTHTPHTTWRTNVLGSLRVFDAVAAAGVPTLLHASSVGAYSPGPKDRPVDEEWPTHGWPEAAYTREKAYLERVLDAFEQRHPATRVVRMRPGFIFQRESAAEQRRLFAGPFLPNALVRPEFLPWIRAGPASGWRRAHTTAREAGAACGPRVGTGHRRGKPALKRLDAEPPHLFDAFRLPLVGVGKRQAMTGERHPPSGKSALSQHQYDQRWSEVIELAQLPRPATPLRPAHLQVAEGVVDITPPGSGDPPRRPTQAARPVSWPRGGGQPEVC
ncbi:NAD-dependent epimerase/dehydratase family protein [Streptomyces sp. Ac-502]|uniref:NAD-dependent epimerase/dehydratase family protein n=1 Tax=Streptomyces sp. Ac-502 TaxID=3342801 RepID=UPI0038625C0E